MQELKKADYREMYRWLYLTRHTEERMVEYHHHSPLTELPHVSIGQEAISVGACYNLRADDQILPSLRTRGAFLVKGISSRQMMAGAFAKVTGSGRGKNTSHHLGDRKAGVIAGSGIVGGHIALGVGTALAAKLKKQDYVSVVFFGDGAANRGDFHEALNLAAIWKLPVVFVCENNLYAISTPASYHVAIENIADRAAGYGMPGVVVDGNDVLAVYEAAQKAYDRARQGEGPTLMECKTYRWRGHSERDPRDGRPPEEIEAWKQRCPLKKYKQYLLSESLATVAELEQIEDKVRAEVEDSIKFAEDSPFPPAEEALLHTYATQREVM
jgi:TPP-dependent pyruvate/acetoin dehydrogenase alpha subunit